MNSIAKQNRKPDNVYPPFLPSLFSQVYDSKQVLCKVCSVFVTETAPAQSTALPPVTTEPAPGLHVVRGHVANLTARVLAHLADVEVQARLADRDDIRVAWILVLKASEGHPDPFSIAFWQYYGETPGKLIPFWSARAEANRLPFPDKYLPFRYTQDWQGEFARIMAEISVPKKPAHSVGRRINKEAA